MADLIDRQAVLALAKDIVVGEYSHRCIDPQLVRELPTIEDESVRHAYWIKKMTVKLCVGFDVYEPHWYCSYCKEKYEPSFAQICKYCYVCGAKMDEERKEE